MTARVDTLDQSERLRGPFLGSIVLHAAMMAVFVGATVGHFLGRNVIQLGDQQGGGFGSVAVTPTATIPIYHPPAPTNPVANDTKSQVPEPVTKPKPQPQPRVKVPEPD